MTENNEGIAVTEKTYEMLWDCPYCGTKKLLGKTHRHCPSCGAPQDPSKRYFPPEEEKVAVEDHEYFGKDVVCPSCGEANSRHAKHCGNCGGPLEGGKDVAAQQEVVIPDGATGEQQPGAGTSGGASAAKTKSLVGVFIGGVFLLLVVAVVAYFVLGALWTKAGAYQVTGHKWSRQVPIERYSLEKQTKTCDKLPKDAKNVTRKKQKPVCKTRKVDQGDGTYKEKRECKAQVDLCTFSAGKWSVERTEKASGDGLDKPLTWPSVHLTKTGTCEGCEREGQRVASYTVLLKDTKSGKEQTCSYSDEAKWRSFKVGSKWAGKASGLTGGLKCGSLKPAK